MMKSLNLGKSGAYWVQEQQENDHDLQYTFEIEIINQIEPKF